MDNDSTPNFYPRSTHPTAYLSLCVTIATNSSELVVIPLTSTTFASEGLLPVAREVLIGARSDRYVDWAIFL